jgi:hypothetical protein
MPIATWLDSKFGKRFRAQECTIRQDILAVGNLREDGWHGTCFPPCQVETTSIELTIAIITPLSAILRQALICFPCCTFLSPLQEFFSCEIQEKAVDMSMVDDERSH